MYTCICNALRERQVEAAISSGAQSSGEVFRALDCRPQCGRCVPEVCAKLRARRNACGRMLGVAAE
ncbi:(2Fe-2S)-binding protein [Zavarzinia sp. CC-PAN008]|uniref:(2Fe-2S)-binding protein n=1 Tax=Zavarzinia sp. CC-PAN008 TaxID=3243332 RepID=UPI003F747E39